ncbi:MAG: aminoacyl-tRNA hydrolase [bacterium]
MRLIVGLGNPGVEYRRTRHNVGFMVVDALAKELGLDFITHRLTGAEVAKEAEIILAKPGNFMNNSGGAVARLAGHFRVSPAGILVIYDDVDLPIGKWRVRLTGRSGGHKGMQSVLDRFQADDIARLRIGVGKDTRQDTSDYVLENFHPAELSTIKSVIKEVIPEIQTWISKRKD